MSRIAKRKPVKFLVLLLIFIGFVPVGIAHALPQGPSDIDGLPVDWLGGTGGAATCFQDEGGADDETNPARADITRFCVHMDASGIYLLYAWDDTRPQGGGTASSVLVDVDGDLIPDYVIGNTIDSIGQNLEMDGLEIGICDDAACSSTTLTCSERLTPGQCVGSAAAIGDTMPDPFANPLRTACGGTNCATVDAFLEMYVPWSLIGGSPPATFAFLTYRSSPSATANSINDNSADVTGNGIGCGLAGCYTSGPTDVSLRSVGAESGRPDKGWLISLAFLTLMTGWIRLRKSDWRLG